MKSLIAISGSLILSIPAYASNLSSCEEACFEKKQSCNSHSAHALLSTCGEDLFDCRTNCKSGNIHSTAPLLDISFQPTLKIGK